MSLNYYFKIISYGNNVDNLSDLTQDMVTLKLLRQFEFECL